MIVGYARVSSEDQSLDIQIAGLLAHGCDKVFSEKLSGTTNERPELQRALEFCRSGDTLVVTRLDRFARSARDLHNMLEQLTDKQVGFQCTEQQGIDTTTPMGRMVLGILGNVAEFETALRAERQREGIQAAKARGVYKGRQASIDAKEVSRLLSTGMKPSDVARTLGINRASVYRLGR